MKSKTDSFRKSVKQTLNQKKETKIKYILSKKKQVNDFIFIYGSAISFKEFYFFLNFIY